MAPTPLAEIGAQQDKCQLCLSFGTLRREPVVGSRIVSKYAQRPAAYEAAFIRSVASEVLYSARISDLKVDYAKLVVEVCQASWWKVHGYDLLFRHTLGAYFLWLGNRPCPHAMNQRVSRVVQMGDSGELLL